MTLLDFTGEAGVDLTRSTAERALSIDSSASLLLLLRTMPGRDSGRPVGSLTFSRSLLLLLLLVLLLSFSLLGEDVHPLRPIPQSVFHPRSESSLASQMRQSEKRRNSRSRGWSLRSIWRRGPRLRRVRPGSISWNGRFGVARCRARRERV